jgi:hypothetical protein
MDPPTPQSIARSWKGRYAQSSSTARKCSDSSQAGDKPLDHSHLFQFSESYFRLETKRHLRSPSVRPDILRWERMTFGRQPGTAVFLVTITLLAKWGHGGRHTRWRAGPFILRYTNNSDLRWRRRNSHRFFSQTSFLSARRRTPALRGLRQIPQPFER